MSEKSVRRSGKEHSTVDWPSAVMEAPEYPELNLSRFDLACDVITYKPKLEYEPAN